MTSARNSDLIKKIFKKHKREREKTKTKVAYPFFCASLVRGSSIFPEGHPTEELCH